MAEPFSAIVRLAAANRVVRLGYRRPGEQAASEYVVEPYRLHRFSTGPVVHCWQRSPVPEGRAPWRDFRVDRIMTVDDAGESFAPRMPVTLPQDADAGTPEVTALAPLARWSERPIEAASPSDEYFRQLESAMLDGQVTPEEVALTKELGDRIEPNERKSVHARIYASVLNEVVADGRISHREEIYLQQVRKLLDGLGWAP